MYPVIISGGLNLNILSQLGHQRTQNSAYSLSPAATPEKTDFLPYVLSTTLGNAGGWGNSSLLTLGFRK